MNRSARTRCWKLLSTNLSAKNPAKHSSANWLRDLGKIHSICVGADFVFGHQRSGNVALLKKLGAELVFTVHGLAAVSLDGQIVSSTRIREAIRAGDLDAASQMLGRPYAISGRVVEGDRLGRQLGFPTANLDAASLVLPPNGVYSGSTKLKGQLYRVALNIGFRPTVAAAAPQLRVEAHLLDFDGDLYGEELEVEIGRKAARRTEICVAGGIARANRPRHRPGASTGLILNFSGFCV